MLGKKTYREIEKIVLNNSDLQDRLLDSINNDTSNNKDEISIHDLDSKEIEQNKHILKALTSIRFNFEIDELNINTRVINNSKDEIIQIKDLFRNHV